MSKASCDSESHLQQTTMPPSRKSDAAAQHDEDAVGVCCGCFSGSGGSGGGSADVSMKKKSDGRSPPPTQQQETTRKPTTTTSPRPTTPMRGSEVIRRAGSIYFEAQDGIIEEADLEFFDAVEELGDLQEEYPVITTAVAPRKSIKFTFNDPEAMLRRIEDEVKDDSNSDTFQEASGEKRETQEAGETPNRGMAADLPIKASFHRRASADVTKKLQDPEVQVMERGYPGQLNEKELQACQDFYREVHKRKGTIRNIVFAYKDIEDEPYTICRFLRPTRFNANEMIKRLEDNKAIWEKAAASNFYPDLQKAMGIPTSLFSRFYPFFYQGNAKNGCPVNYFKAGSLHVEGLLAMVTIEQINRNAWNTCKYVFPSMIEGAHAKNPNFVRCESVNVLDLEGLTSSQLTSDAMEIIKQAAKVGDFFPETMHCMLIINAPTWFSATWKLIRTFIDARTAKKIEVYTSASRGSFRLQQLIDAAEIPHDFGGFGPSTSTPTGANRESLQVLHVSKKYRSTQDVPCLAEVAKGEKITSIEVYSRSATGVLIDFEKDGTPLQTDFPVNPPKMPASGTSLDPYVFKVVKKPIEGPCTISLKARALPDEKRAPSKASFGYFVVVVFITKE